MSRLGLLVHEHEERASYARWFLAGDVGLIWMFLNALRAGLLPPQGTGAPGWPR